jgi:hypothetical protein
VPIARRFAMTKATGTRWSFISEGMRRCNSPTGFVQTVLGESFRM